VTVCVFGTFNASRRAPIDSTHSAERFRDDAEELGFDKFHYEHGRKLRHPQFLRSIAIFYHACRPRPGGVASKHVPNGKLSLSSMISGFEKAVCTSNFKQCSETRPQTIRGIDS
jgi:hypothetical protein